MGHGSVPPGDTVVGHPLSLAVGCPSCGEREERGQKPPGVVAPFCWEQFPGDQSVEACELPPVHPHTS